MKIIRIFLFLLPVVFAMPRLCRFRARCRTARVRSGLVHKSNQRQTDEPIETDQQVQYRPRGLYGATSNTQRGYFLEQARQTTESSKRINDIIEAYFKSIGR